MHNVYPFSSYNRPYIKIACN